MDAFTQKTSQLQQSLTQTHTLTHTVPKWKKCHRFRILKMLRVGLGVSEPINGAATEIKSQSTSSCVIASLLIQLISLPVHPSTRRCWPSYTVLRLVCSAEERGMTGGVVLSHRADFPVGWGLVDSLKVPQDSGSNPLCIAQDMDEAQIRQTISWLLCSSHGRPVSRSAGQSVSRSASASVSRYKVCMSLSQSARQ